MIALRWNEGTEWHQIGDVSPFTGARKRVLRVCAHASLKRAQLMEQLDYHLLYRQNKWAGNLDLKVLGVGSTLYIPVFNEGALFFTGDPHGVQGDGEVDGGALEQLAHRHAAVHPAQGRGQGYALAARGGRRQALALFRT